MKIETINKKYPSQWVLAQVLEVDELNQPTKLEVLAHSKNRDETYKAMGKSKFKSLAHFFTGSIPKKGYAVAF